MLSFRRHRPLKRSGLFGQPNCLAFSSFAVDRNTADIEIASEPPSPLVRAIPCDGMPASPLALAVDDRSHVKGEVVPYAHKHMRGILREHIGDLDGAAAEKGYVGQRQTGGMRGRDCRRSNHRLECAGLCALVDLCSAAIPR